MLLFVLLAALALLNLLAWLAFGLDWLGLAALLPLHCLSAAGLAVLGQRLLPPAYRQPMLGGIAFLLMLCVAIPVLGCIGVCAALLPGLLQAPKAASQLTQRTEIPALPYKPVTLADQNFSSGGIFDVLKHAESSEKRTQAVMATQHMRTRMAVPLLRLALRDSDDDVRLLAYGILDKKENQVNAIINGLLASISHGDAPNRDAVKEQLAQQYWEMAYLGLAEGDVRRNMLEKAQALLDEVIDEGRHRGAGAYLLQGKVYLAQDKLSEARKAFQGAKLIGVGDAVLAPYLAEIAFMERDYKQVQTAMRSLKESGIDEPALRGQLNYWTEAPA